MQLKKEHNFSFEKQLIQSIVFQACYRRPLLKNGVYCSLHQNEG